MITSLMHCVRRENGVYFRETGQFVNLGTENGMEMRAHAFWKLTPHRASTYSLSGLARWAGAEVALRLRNIILSWPNTRGPIMRFATVNHGSLLWRFRLGSLSNSSLVLGNMAGNRPIPFRATSEFDMLKRQLQKN